VIAVASVSGLLSARASDPYAPASPRGREGDRVVIRTSHRAAIRCMHDMSMYGRSMQRSSELEPHWLSWSVLLLAPLQPSPCSRIIKGSLAAANVMVVGVAAQGLSLASGTNKYVEKTTSGKPYGVLSRVYPHAPPLQKTEACPTRSGFVARIARMRPASYSVRRADGSRHPDGHR